MYAFAPYLVRVISNQKMLNLSAMPCSSSGKKLSLFTIFAQTLQANALAGGVQISGTDKVLSYTNPVVATDGSVHGIIEVGEFGYSQKIVNSKTGGLAYSKMKDEAGLIPFFVRLAPTPKPDRAILLCQKFRTFGIKTHIHEALGPTILKIDPMWSLRIEKIVPMALITKFLSEGEVKTVRFISHDAPSDVADDLKQLTPDKDAACVEVVVRAKRGKSFGSGLLDLIKQKKPVTGLLTLPQMDYDTLKVDIEIGGKRKTLDLTNMHKIGGVVDVTDELKFDNNGHPTLTSLLASSRDLIVELRAEI